MERKWEEEKLYDCWYEKCSTSVARVDFVRGKKKTLHRICETLVTSNNGGHNNGKCIKPKSRIRDEKLKYIDSDFAIKSYEIFFWKFRRDLAWIGNQNYKRFGGIEMKGFESNVELF